MKTILVTGGAGFLGSHLCEKLLESADNRVIALDNLYTGRRENLRALLGRAEFTFLEGDVCALPDMAVDEIYNAACPASPPAYQKSPTDTIRTCVAGMTSVLELARKCGARVLQFSTSEVYGDPAVHPQREDYWGNVNPIGLRSCYDEGKRCAEALCFAYHREYGVPIKVVRIFNTYGPRMDPRDGRVVSNLLMQALRGEELTIYGDGTQTRSFCYVEDLIEGLVRMMASPAELTGPVNLGNDGEFTLLELAALVKEITGSAAPLRFCPLPENDPVRRRPDLSLARRELGWAPTTALREGLERTAEYYREVLAAEKP